MTRARVSAGRHVPETSVFETLELTRDGRLHNCRGPALLAAIQRSDLSYRDAWVHAITIREQRSSDANTMVVTVIR
jgi:hypothetical protein